MPWVKLLLAVLLSTAALAVLPPASGQATVSVDTVFLSLPGTNNGASVPCDTASFPLTELTAAPAAGKAYTTRGFGGLGCPTVTELILPRDWKPAAPITINYELGCDTPTVSPNVPGATTGVRFQVFHDGTQVGGNINLNGANVCTPGTPILYQATADISGETFLAGQSLRVNALVFYGPAGGGGDPQKGLHFLVGGARPSYLILPGLSSGGQVEDGGGPLDLVEYYNVTELDFEVVRSMVDANQTEVYSWTSTFSTAVVNYTNSVVEGNATLTIIDASNDTVLASPLASGSAEVELPFTTPGNWTILLEFENYTGELNVSIREPPSAPGVMPDDDDEGQAGGGDGDDEGQAGDGNATLDQEEADKESPGLALPALAALLALAVALRRRRA